MKAAHAQRPLIQQVQGRVQAAAGRQQRELGRGFVWARHGRDAACSICGSGQQRRATQPEHHAREVAGYECCQ